MIYVFSGPPGSGKSTQSQLMAKHLDLTNYPMSKMLRDEAQRFPELNDIMARGDLVQNKFTHLALQQIAEANEESAILDAFPRDVAQLNDMLHFWQPSEITVIQLVVSDDTIIQRISRRAEAEHRTDDRPDVLRHRLALFYQNEAKLFDALHEHNIRILEIDGEPSPDVINLAIEKAINA